MKTCFKCGVAKDISEFYAHPMMADGHLGKCKECSKRDVRANRKSKLSYYREYDRDRAGRAERVAARSEYATSPRGRSVAKMAKSRWIARNRDKSRCHLALRRAIAAGKVERQPCELCGAKAQAHHDDYAKPLDVRWLCPKHHSEHHAKLRAILREQEPAA